jgi:DNA-binding Lrp family transcriptional regulator
MKKITEKDKAIVLLLTKDFTADYNARSLSQHIGMSPRGALKALKALEQQGIVQSKRIGQASIYKLSLDTYSQKLASLFLFEEARTKTARWLEEFKDFKEAEIIILFGSILRQKDNRDIDIMLVTAKKGHAALEKRIIEKKTILVKPIHPIWQTRNDLKNNLIMRDKAILEILKAGIVLKGYDALMEVLASVARRE